MKKNQDLKSFIVRRRKSEIITCLILFVVFAGAFAAEVFRFRQTLIEGSPFPDMAYFQAANNEFWAGQIAGFVLFLVLFLVGMFFMLAVIRFRIFVDGNMLIIRKTIGKSIQIHISEISGVDMKKESYILMRGTKALTKVKPTDENLAALLIRLGVIGQ